MKPARRRSLFLRLFLGLSCTMLLVWSVILVRDVFRVEQYKEEGRFFLRVTAEEFLIAAESSVPEDERILQAVSGLENLRDTTLKKYNAWLPEWYVQVWHGDRLIHATQLPLQGAAPSTGGPGSAPVLPVGMQWEGKNGRIVDWEHATLQNPQTGITVRVDKAVTPWGFQLTLKHLWLCFAPLLYCLPLLLIPAWLLIRIGLHPLRRVAAHIAQRSPSDLSPLPLSPYREIAPLVASINRLMIRLSERLQREKEFLLDAAHELKTPLAVIQVNAGLLASTRDQERMQQASAGLRLGVVRAAHTTHQLRTLIRSDADRDDAVLQPMDLAQLVGDRLAAAVPLALRRGIEIELHAPDTCTLPLHRESAVSMIDNLIDNAVKYSPDNGKVTVTIVADAQSVRLTVTDQGPGIAPEFRKKVFERFFRMPDQEQKGSGLGLAIAEKAAALNRAAIELDAGPVNAGLAASVEFTLARSAPSASAGTSRFMRHEETGGSMPVNDNLPPRHRSLFFRLLAGFVVVIALSWAGVFGTKYFQVRQVALSAGASDVDYVVQHMLTLIRPISDRPQAISVTATRFENWLLEPPPFITPEHFKWHWQIWRGKELIHDNGNFGLPSALPSSDKRPAGLLPDEPGWGYKLVHDPATDLSVRVVRGPLPLNWRLLSLIEDTTTPLLYGLPFLLIPAWLVILVGLRPLRRIADHVAQRSPSDLSPLPPSPYREIAPLVDAINRMMARLSERLQREKQFLIDTTHELESPLEVIQVNAGLLAASRNPQFLTQANSGLQEGVARAVHTVHQLLALARSDADRDDAMLQTMDLTQLVGDRLAAAVPLALRRGIEIELHAPDTCTLPLHRESAVSMIDNLIDNAVKYSPDNGKVTVTIVADAQSVRLTVTDQGPGIAPEFRKKVFERFFRMPDQEQKGSGLGLAIAEKAAALNRAAIELGTGPGNAGLAASVIFADPDAGTGPEHPAPDGAREANGAIAIS